MVSVSMKQQGIDIENNHRLRTGIFAGLDGALPDAAGCGTLTTPGG